MINLANKTELIVVCPLLSDFYAHTNWVDAIGRGGEVCNKLDGGKYEYGYVPTGLNQTSVWDEQSNLENIYSGTVSIFSDHADCSVFSMGDINCTQDETTHGYWNKDHDAAHTDDAPVDGQALADKGLYYWKYTQFDSTKITGVLGVDYFTDSGLPPVEGSRIYIRSIIENTHQLAFQLAIMHTMQEIQTLYDKAAGVIVGSLNLQEVFAMSKVELNTNKLGYTDTPAMNQGVQDEQKN